jgi:hypothetical protein
MSRIPYLECFLEVDCICTCHRCNHMSHKHGDQGNLGSHSRFYEAAMC